MRAGLPLQWERLVSFSSFFLGKSWRGGSFTLFTFIQEHEFDGLVEHPDQHLWEDKSLRLSSKTMHSRKGLEHFIKQLATAPCIKTLTLFLQEYWGEVPPPLKLAQDALSKVSCASFFSVLKGFLLNNLYISLHWVAASEALATTSWLLTGYRDMQVIEITGLRIFVSLGIV